MPPQFCVNCGRKANERPILPVDTVSPDVGICATCAIALMRKIDEARYNISNLVGEDIDNQIAKSGEYKSFLAREAAGQPTCRHCSAPVPVLPGGKAQLWCDDCERRRKQLELGIRT